MAIERRRHPRYPAQLYTSIALPDGTWPAEAVDLGLGGAFFHTDAPLQPGQEIEACVRPAREGTALVVQRATVVYVVKKGSQRGAGAGVTWHPPQTEMQQSALRRLVNDLAQRVQDPIAWLERATAEYDVGRLDSSGRGPTGKHSAVRPEPRS